MKSQYWRLAFGLITSFTITFTLLPTLLNFVKTDNISVKEEKESKITLFLEKLSIHHQKSIFAVTIFVIVSFYFTSLKYLFLLYLQMLDIKSGTG